MDTIFNDEHTQALSIGFREDNLTTGIQHFRVIFTIIFRIVWDDKYKDQFIFIYYRATDDRPLSERQMIKDDLFSDYSKKMENHGFGRFLIILAHSNSYPFSQKEKVQKFI